MPISRPQVTYMSLWAFAALLVDSKLLDSKLQYYFSLIRDLLQEIRVVLESFEISNKSSNPSNLVRIKVRLKG